MKTKSNDIKVSVIIPTYKRANMVCLTLDSLLEQNFPKENFEVVIVDNNSPDNTKEVIASYFTKNKGKANMVYLCEKRQGDGYARNSGGAVARGKYLLFADDDSLFDKNWISCMTEILDLYPNVGIVGSKILIKWDEEPSPWVKRYEYLLARITFANDGYLITSRRLIIPNCSLGISRELFYKVGGNNPGQIGEWLVGDAEVGLCNKVMQLGYPMAFTDDTTMWHMQTKAKNGTYKDLIRRLQNIAISDAYGAVVVKGKPVYRNINQSLYKVIRSVFKFKRSRIREAVFQYLSNKEYNKYIDWYQSEEFLKIQESLKDHWLSENYIAPKPDMSIVYILQK